MHARIASAVLIALVAGCGGGPAAPSTVRPTLSAIETLGFDCGAGISDNVPSGLSQWSCAGKIQGQDTVILVDGNEAGVTGISLGVRTSNDPAVARDGFQRLVASVPPLTSAPTLVDTLAIWSGEQQRPIVDGLAVWAECDETQCVVMVVGSTDALRPLPLP